MRPDSNVHRLEHSWTGPKHSWERAYFRKFDGVVVRDAGGIAQ
jgi:hypothetical protein